MLSQLDTELKEYPDNEHRDNEHFDIICMIFSEYIKKESRKNIANNVNKISEEKEYDIYKNNVCSVGLHYFNKIECVFCFMLNVKSYVEHYMKMIKRRKNLILLIVKIMVIILVSVKIVKTFLNVIM